MLYNYFWLLSVNKMQGRFPCCGTRNFVSFVRITFILKKVVLRLLLSYFRHVQIETARKKISLLSGKGAVLVMFHVLLKFESEMLLVLLEGSLMPKEGILKYCDT